MAHGRERNPLIQGINLFLMEIDALDVAICLVQQGPDPHSTLGKSSITMTPKHLLCIDWPPYLIDPYNNCVAPYHLQKKHTNLVPQGIYL